MTFDPDAFASGGASSSSGFDPDAFAAGPDADTFRQRGQRQADGTWLVQTPQGPVRLDADGNPLEEIHTPGGSQDVDATSKEGVLNRILATAQGGAQGLVPQLYGAKEALLGGDYATARDEARKTVKAATEEAGMGYEIAGSLASSALAAPETMAGRLAVAGGLGAVGAGAETGGDLESIAKGAGVGLVAGAAGEALGAGVRKLGAKLWGAADDALARQTAKDAKWVEDEIASLSGKLGAETQKGSRMLENMQRGATGVADLGSGTGAVGPGVRAQLVAALRDPGSQELAEKVAESALKKYPGQKATIDRLEAELAARQAGATEEAAKRTADYFASSVWKTEIAPRLANQAPRFYMAAAGAAFGELFGQQVGMGKGQGSLIGLGLGGLGSPGVRQMVKNIGNSNRIRVATAEKLIPVLLVASQSIRHGIVPTAAILSRATISESDLGDLGLAAEQLAARGGISSVLGDHPPDVRHLSGLDAPHTPLDQAFSQTAGVTALAGTLEAQHAEIDKAVEHFLGGKVGKLQKPQPMPSGVHELAADDHALVDRVTNNLGGLSTVAPGISASLTGVAQRAVQHLSTLSAAPPQRGPISPEWRQTQSEKRIIDQAYSVIDNPLVILDHARTGTLTKAHLDAARAVYPMLTQAISDRALDAAIGSDKKPSYRQRQMLTLLTGIDVDGERAMIASNQRTIAAPSQKPSNAGTPGSKGAEKLTLGSRMAEPHQRERDTE